MNKTYFFTTPEIIFQSFVGIGLSMGGATTVLAEVFIPSFDPFETLQLQKKLSHPGLFAGMLLMEPIIHSSTLPFYVMRNESNLLVLSAG